MTAWTSDELTSIGAADELQISSARRDGTLGNPRTIWVVRVGDDLYVRSMYGRAGGWFPGTQVRHQGHIRAGGVDTDVTFADADPDLNDQIDAAYRDKYRRYGERIIGGVVNPGARAATIKLMPNREARLGASAQSGPELPPGSDRAGDPSSSRRKPAREE